MSTSGAAEHTTVRWGGKTHTHTHTHTHTKRQSKQHATSTTPLEASLRLQVSNSDELFGKVNLPTFSCVYQRGGMEEDWRGVWWPTPTVKSGYVISCPAPMDEYKTECCVSKCFYSILLRFSDQSNTQPASICSLPLLLI